MLKASLRKVDVDLLFTLCKYGADIDDQDRLSILLKSPINNGDLEGVKFLLEKGAKITIDYALNNKQYEIVKYLCENGYTAGIRGHSNILKVPSSDGETEIVKMLLSLGANPVGGLEAALKFYHKEIVELLIQFGAAQKVSFDFFLTADEPF